MPRLNYKHSKETKKKISLSHLGIKPSEETRRKLRLSHLGIKPSNETKEKMSKSQKGRKHSNETKKKISIANKGNKARLGMKNSKKQKDAISKAALGNKYWLGKKHTEETKILMSKKQKGRFVSEETRKKQSKIRKGKSILKVRGSKHWNWKGGITPINKKIKYSIEFKLWREAVFKRDNFTCQKTNIGGKLNAHHINNFAEFPKLRFVIDNGITLSEKMHQEFHKKYGRTNNTKEQLLEFLKK